MKGLALGLYTNSFALGLRVDFFSVDETLSTEEPSLEFSWASPPDLSSDGAGDALSLFCIVRS